MVPQSSEISSPIETRDEHALVACLRFSDDELARAAFAELYRTHVSGLLRFAYGYVHSKAVAEDIVADVFLIIWSRRALWEPKHGVRAYLYTSVQRRALNHQRAEKRADRWHHAAVADGGLLAGSPPGADAIEEAFYDKTLGIMAILAHAIAALPEEARRIAELRWRDGMAPTEIANILGINRAAVDNRLSRLLKRLRAVVEVPR